MRGMTLDYLISELTRLKQQGADRVYVSHDWHSPRPIRSIDRDRDGDVIMWV